MRTLLRSINIISWPIWAKLLGGFLIAILLPAALIAFVALVGLRESIEQNVSSLVAENGARNVALVNDQLGNAYETLAEIEQRPERLNPILQLVAMSHLTNTTVEALNAQTAQVVAILQADLLPIDDGYFTSVRILDRDGILVTRAFPPGRAVTNLAGQDESGTATYLNAVNAVIQGEHQTLTVVEQGAPAIEVSQTLHWHDGSVIGYMVGAINVGQVLYEQVSLAGVDESASAYTFVVSRNGTLFSPAQIRDQAERSMNSVAVERALEGETGVDSYQVGGGNGVQVVGYYAPIPETPLAMITEVESTPLINSVLDYFGGARAFAVVVGTALLMGVLVLLFNQLLSPPLNRLRQAIIAMTSGNYDEPVQPAERGDEIGSLATAFVDMRTQVRTLVNELETRVATRTRDMNATQEIGRFAATQRDVQVLMDQVVNLIVERFPNIYHAQIFLLDNNREWAVLESSTGEAGRMLLARGQRLAVGSLSVIGQGTEQGQVIVARDTASSRVHRRNEFLPDTRAELAIPLKVGDAVIGALDVQSRENDAFEADETGVLQTMADQIAVAIENARLYQVSLRRLEEIEHSNRLATLTAWERFMHEQRVQQLSSTAGVQTGLDMSDLRQQAVAQNRIVVGELTERYTVPIAVPIQLRGQMLGAVEWELPAQDFDDNKLQLAQELANRLAISLDNARLFQETQRTTERERLVSSIAAKLTAQTDVEEILQTAVREVGQALRSPQVSIRLNRPNADNHHNGNGKE
jgi:GAF domain-containing protein/HAMP domain-containing protein